MRLSPDPFPDETPLTLPVALPIRRTATSRIPHRRHRAAQRYEAFDDAGEPIVADDAAVSIAAAHGARVILDVLDEAVDDDAAAWLLIGCRRAWLFTSGHGHVIRLDVGKPDAPVGNPDALEPAENSEAREFALELARSYLDATSTSA